MKRRSFLKILSLAPAVAAVPSSAMAAIKLEAAPLMSGAAAFFYRPDIDSWVGHAFSGTVAFGAQRTQYVFVSIFGNREPDEGMRSRFCQFAEAAFERARKRANGQ